MVMPVRSSKHLIALGTLVFIGCAPESSCDSNADCEPTEFCQFDARDCGDSAPGRCMPRPTTTSLVFDPVCACDGSLYSHFGRAWAAGVDLDDAHRCPPFEDDFACGFRSCSHPLRACRWIDGDPECGAGECDTAECSCLMTLCPTGFCTRTSDGISVLTCPDA